jgi:exopolyphosphatase/guanosine-5'-triphosphate,3'-diphosphate pyrophosphatase
VPVSGGRVAAIDVGTNTTRLLAVEAAPGGLDELDRRLAFTRLGEGVDASGRLAGEAIDRTVGAIATYAARCRELTVGRVRVAGTSAVREAANRAELQAAVRAATGYQLDAVSGEEEAALSFAGATQDLPAGRYLVCDIGGGSTELAAGTKRGGGAALEGGVSLPLGVVRMTERHRLSDPPSAAELAAMEADIDGVLEGAPVALGEGAGLVGVAGTVTSLAAIDLGLTGYDPKAVHGSCLAPASIEALYRRLATMTTAEREQLPALPPGRADVIVAGCAILTRVMARWGFPAVRVSDKDILDGLVLGILGRL